MKKLNILIILSLISLYTVAQDYTLSQLTESPILLNPANAGLTHPVRITTNFRQQWRSISTPYNTIVLSVDGLVLSQGDKGSSLGLGVLLLNDKAGRGQLNSLNANLALMGKIMINEIQSLSAGIIGGVIQRQIDLNELTWTDQFNGISYDPTIPHGENIINEKVISPDLGLGMQWSYGRGSETLSSGDMIGAQVCLGAYHINMPSTGFYEEIDKRYVRYLLHGSFSYRFSNTPYQVNPVIIAQKQGPARMFYGGTYVKYDMKEYSKISRSLYLHSINLGLFYRVGDSFINILHFEFNQVALGISYDFNLSKLTKASYGRGGMELSIKYTPANLSFSKARL